MVTTREMTSRNLVQGRDVHVVVLVGGRDFGRCPLAAHLPTALWPMADKSVLAHLLDHLAEAGIGRVAVCCAQDDAATVEAVCKEAPLGVALVIEELTAGTAGCLRNAVASDPGDLVLVLSGSMLAPPPIGDLVAAQEADQAELTMVFNPGRSGEQSLGSPAEIYLCRPEILQHVPPGGYCDIKEGLIPAILRAGGSVRPLVLQHPVGNFHNRTGYLQALEVLVRAGPQDGRLAPASTRTAAGVVLQGSNVSAHPTARVCGPVLIGDGARLAEGVVVIGPALIGRSAVVEANSVIVRSAVWSEAQVGPQCEIRESIVDCGATLPAGTALEARTISVGAADRSLSHRLFWSGRREGETPGEPAGSFVARWAAGGVILAAFLWCYWPTIRDLISVWRRSDEYSSGLLVPFLAAYILWLRRRELQSVALQPAVLGGIGAFLVAQVVRGAGLFDLYSFVERFSLILSLAAVVLLVAGWRTLSKVATVLLFLCLMLPWPGRLQNAITLPLQKWSTTSAVFCLELAGYEIRQDGNVIHIGTASVAVAEACNGLRMIMAFIVISGLVVLLVKRAWWEKLILLLSSFPIAFFCNTLRLAATALAFTVIKGERWEQRFHDWGGYAMMPLALALVVGELWFLARLTTPPEALAPLVISRRRPQPVSNP